MAPRRALSPPFRAIIPANAGILHYGTQGGLKGNMEQLEWTYYKPEEAPAQKLVKGPLVNAEGLPCYCNEELTLHTGSWQVEDQYKNIFQAGATRPYGRLYEVLTAGAALEITAEQVRRQIAVIAECRRQNPHIYPKG